MKGLLYKDFVGSLKEIKLVGLIFLFFCAFALIGGKETFDPMLGAMLAIGSMFSLFSLSNDKLAGWDKFICASPISRKKVILTKYVLMLLTDTAVILLIGVTNQLVGSAIPLNFLPLLLAILFFFNSVMFPICLRFGQSLAILIFLLFAFVPLGIVFALDKLNLLPAGFLENISSLQFLSVLSPETAILLLLLATALLLLLSLYLSMRIYEKKEF